MTRIPFVIPAGILVLAGVLSSCAGVSSGSGSAAQAARSDLSAAATSSAVVQARQQAMTEVVTPCKGLLPSLTAFRTCAEGKLGIQGSSPEAKARRGALDSCLFEAAAADRVTMPHNQAGRLAFENGGAPDCVSQILLAPSPSASPS